VANKKIFLDIAGLERERERECVCVCVLERMKESCCQLLKGPTYQMKNTKKKLSLMFELRKAALKLSAVLLAIESCLGQKLNSYF